MNKSFQQRLDKAAQGVEKLPPRISTDAENREWAKQQLAEVMAEFKLTRSDALVLAREHAPLIAEWVEGGLMRNMSTRLAKVEQPALADYVPT